MSYVCALVYLCWDVCASAPVRILEPVCMPQGVHGCVCMCVCVLGEGSCFSCIYVSAVRAPEG